MTTQNTSGTLTNRIILSAALDHSLPPPPDWLTPQQSITNKANPDHWQDTVKDSIMTRTTGSGSRMSGSLTPGNEFELDVESLTHTWQTVSVIAPLPGMAELGETTGAINTAQIRTLNIDLGMMREVISVQGILYDSDNHPSSTSGHHIRRQHLLDLARTQWAGVHNYNQATAFEWNNANKYPALTIGPMHGRETGGSNRDSGYYGDEPSSDVRGLQQSSIDFVNQTSQIAWGDNPTLYSSSGNYSWDWTFNYKGRRRYRGLIRRLTLTAIAGQPNIWRYVFDFEVIKNELELRMIGEEPKAEDDSNNKGAEENSPWWKFGFGS